jgi:Na+/H+ antiporter
VTDLEFLLVLLLAAALVVRLSDVLRVPYPIVLVLTGLAIGFTPGLRELELEPDAIFLIFLPPLLHSAGWYSSPRELRAEKRALAALVLGLVFATMAAVAVVAHELVPGLGWPAAFVLGAVVAPTDPVSAVATFARLGAPERVRIVVEGEALLNDGSALVAYRVAVAAALSGSFGVGEAAWEFARSAAGGIAIGLALAWVAMRALRRLDDVGIAIALTVLQAYGAYVLAEEAGVSGVLATVAAGLYSGWYQHEEIDADTRLSGAAFWRVMTFVLEAMLFILLGLQLPGLVDELDAELSLGELSVAALVVSLTVIAVRLAWVLLPLAQYGEDARERLVVGWSGMRGAVSLAAALAVPGAVDGKAEILFITVVVIVVTLVGQGLTLPPLLAALGVQGEKPWTPDEAIARLEAAQAALDRLDELEAEGAEAETLRRLRDLYRARFRQCMAVLGGEVNGAGPPADPRLAYGELRRELIAVERSTLLWLRDDGRLKQNVLRHIERELDLDEARLR